MTVLDFWKEGEFNEEEEDDDKVNKVVLTIAIEHNILKRKRKRNYLFKFEENEES